MIQISGVKTGKQYWRSLEDLANTSKFQEWLGKEFPAGAAEMPSGPSRRHFMTIMAASFGLAGLASCRRPEMKIYPAVRMAEEQIPGIPLFYATAMSWGENVLGLHVETHEGRPTKIEGNKLHPKSGGAASAFAQASVLGLYDPDRSREPLKDGKSGKWEEFDKAATGLVSGDGDGFRVLSGRVNSPTLDRLRGDLLKKYPKAAWAEYEPLSHDNIREGLKLAFGEAVVPQYHFDKAEVVLSLDFDFLGLDGDGVSWVRDFSKGRKASKEEDKINRLYVVESNYSITGGMADHRLRARLSEIGKVTSQLAELPVVDPKNKWINAVRKDLEAHKGKCLIVAGPRQPAAVHAMVAFLNQQLGAAGETVTYAAAPAPAVAGIKQLAADLSGGNVSTLLVLGGNPAHDAPADLGFGDLIKKAKTSVHLSFDVNDTSAESAWHLPEAHYLESWSDVRASDGTVSVVQPMIDPMTYGRTASEIVSAVLGHKQTGHDLVQATWKLDEKAWRKALHDGVAVVGALPPYAKPAKQPASLSSASSVAPGAGIEVGFYPSATAYDGRFANIAWLQETPDPMTKVVWGNAALMSSKTAKALGLVDGDLVAIEQGGRKVEAPAMVQPGHADDAISLTLGYGRKHTGRVSSGVGYNAYPLRTLEGSGFITGASVKKTGAKHELVTTQEHHRMEGRDIVREGWKEHHEEELITLYDQVADYSKGYQWGLAIDLNSCIGCNACMVACQSENNIPVVGKDQVNRGREMHWIRMDRYYTGSDEDAQVVYQPMACQQCENAPCESVCPVAATSHSPEGLNDMAYNRCIGTRYCSNNCPYKVRRFNFANWNFGMEKITEFHSNPNVTVRTRGVMEKCTYCVQRIQEAKLKTKREGRRELHDGEIVTACQQTCPADAITFGNINDPDSRVSKLKEQSRNYALLEELNIKPRTTYLSKLRNPNPELA